ncbi:C-X-C motif chemokine 16 [Lissotriton helveticus]
MASLPSAGSRGAILAFLLFQLMNPGRCQIANEAGLCDDCKDLRTDLDPLNMLYFANIGTNVTSCSLIIKFKLKNYVVCGKSSEEWVKKLRNCIKKNDFMPCKRKAKKPTPAPAQVTTTRASTAPAPAVVLITTKGSELTTHPTSTPKNPHFTEKDESKIILEPKNDATNETNNDALAEGGGLKDELKNSTPAPETDKMKHLTVAVLSLLAVVFVLVIVVTYLICRRKANQKKYEQVEQNPETNSTIDESFSGNQVI